MKEQLLMMSRPGKSRPTFQYSTVKPTGAGNQQRKRKHSPEEATSGSAGYSGAHRFDSKAKIQRTAPVSSVEDFQDDDDFDNIGAAAIEQYEMTQRMNSGPSNSTPVAQGNQYTSTKDLIPIASNQATSVSSSVNLQATVERLREENYTKDGEVTFLKGEREKLSGQLRNREEQMKAMQTKFDSDKNSIQTKHTKENESLKSTIQFQEQEIRLLREKCQLSEQLKKSPKPVPTRGPKPSSSSNTNFMSSETFMPSSQLTESVRPKRTLRERSISSSECKTNSKAKKVRLSRSPTTTPSEASSRRSSKRSKTSSPISKPTPTVDPNTILSVQSREVDNTQLLMLLVRRDLLKPPVFAGTDEQETKEESLVIAADRDSQSSDEDSSQSSPESGSSSLSGLLSLLRVQPKAKQASGLSYTTSIHSESSIGDSSSHSNMLYTPTTVSTPVRSKRPHIPKPHTLARTEFTRSGLEHYESSTTRSLSANNSPIHAPGIKRTSSLLFSVDKSGLERSIGALLQAADLSSISKSDRTLSTTSFQPNQMYSRMPEDSSLNLLKRIANIIVQYHSGQSAKAKGVANTNTSITEFSDLSSESSASKNSVKSFASSTSSKASSELFCPPKCDQRLATQALEMLETLVLYSQSIREQILLRPPQFLLDSSRPGSSLGMHSGSCSRESSQSVSNTKVTTGTTIWVAPPNLDEVSRRLFNNRENTPETPDKDKHSVLVTDRRLWNHNQLSKVCLPHSNLSQNVWSNKGHSPQKMRNHESSFSLPLSSAKRTYLGLFNALLEMPAPPWPKLLKVVTKVEMSSSQSGGRYTGTADRADLNNHSNQCNPNNSEYRGYTSRYSGSSTKSDLDNHSNQLNPNNQRYAGPKAKK